MHLIVRMYLQPNKDKLDIRKVKRGKLYVTNKKGDPDPDMDKSRYKHEMTNSKIVSDKEKESQNGVKIHQVKVKFYG